MQFVLVHQGGITFVLSTEWFTWLSEWEISCGASASVRSGLTNLSVADFMQQFYNPGVANFGDVPIEFTNMLAVNVLLGIVSAVFLLILASTLYLARLSRRATRDQPTDEDAPLAKIFRGPERTILAQSGVAMIALMIIGPILLVRATNPAAATSSVNDLLWIGPFIMLIDLSRLMLVGSLRKPATPDIVVDQCANEKRKPILKVTLDNLCSEFSRSYERHIEIPTITERPALADNGGIFVPEPGEGRYFLGTLKAQNYEEILACLNLGVLDRGRTALIVCPDAVLMQFSTNIIERLQTEHQNFDPHTWLANTQLEEDDGPLDIIFASPETLGTILDRIKIVKGEIATLGGIIVIGMHRMDVGLLSLGLRRLKPFVENPASMIGVAQSEELGNARNFLGFLPLFSELREKPPIQVDLDLYGPSYTLILRQRQGASFERREDWPDWVKVLWSTRRSEPRADVYLFDTAADHAATLWRDRVLVEVDGNYDSDTIAWGRTLRTPSIFPIDAPHPAVLIKDRGNLADALRLSVADTQSIENLRILATGDYPGASFLRAKLTEELNRVQQAREYKRALARFCIKFGSYLPKPQGGPVELALLVQQEYKSTMRRGFALGGENSDLSQDGLERIWAEREEPLEELGISNTRVGLERLFRQTFRVSNTASFVTREESSDRRWTYNLTATSLANSDILATYALEQNQNAPLPGTADRGVYSLIAADHGLNYAEGTRISVGGGLYEIRSVNSGRKTVLVQPENSIEPRGLTFVRDYAIRVRSDDPSKQFAADMRRAVQDTPQAFEIATGYAHVARRTTAVLENGADCTPLSEDGTPPKRIQTAILSDYRLRSIAIMRLYQGKAQPNPRASQTARRIFGRGAVSRGRGSLNNPLTGTLPPNVAFTLITTLQDVLGLMFQSQHHRIAVVSHDAIVLPPVRSVSFNNITSYCLERQPSLAPSTGDQAFAAESRNLLNRHVHGQDVRSDYNAFANAFITQARARQGVKEATIAPLLTLTLIEDSDHDLGVARFLNSNFIEVQEYWRDYLEHYADCWRRREPHDYTFGSKVQPSCYDFQGAFDIVKGMA